MLLSLAKHCAALMHSSKYNYLIIHIHYTYYTKLHTWRLDAIAFRLNDYTDTGGYTTLFTKHLLLTAPW